MTSPIRLLFSFLLSLALHRCLLIEIRERRYTPPRTRLNPRRIDRCTLALRIWRPESSSLWLDGQPISTLRHRLSTPGVADRLHQLWQDVLFQKRPPLAPGFRHHISSSSTCSY